MVWERINTLRPSDEYVRSWVFVGCSGYGLSPVVRQAITWTTADILSFWPLATNFGQILSKMLYLSVKKKQMNRSSAKYRPFPPNLNVLTHWGRVTHICVGKLIIIGSDNGLSPDRRQAFIWTNSGLLLIGPLGTNFSEISIEILTFSFRKMRLKVSSAKRRPFFSASMC